jgi:hypothetical protein
MEQVKKYTASHAGVAVKAISPSEHSFVFVNGREEEEPGPGVRMLPVLEPIERPEMVDAASFIPTTFYLGKWNTNDRRFVPDGEPPISLQDFLSLAESQ